MPRARLLGDGQRARRAILGELGQLAEERILFGRVAAPARQRQEARQRHLAVRLDLERLVQDRARPLGVAEPIVRQVRDLDVERLGLGAPPIGGLPLGQPREQLRQLRPLAAAAQERRQPIPRRRRRRPERDELLVGLHRRAQLAEALVQRRATEEQLDDDVEVGLDLGARGQKLRQRRRRRPLGQHAIEHRQRRRMARHERQRPPRRALGVLEPFGVGVELAEPRQRRRSRLRLDGIGRQYRQPLERLALLVGGTAPARVLRHPRQRRPEAAVELESARVGRSRRLGATEVRLQRRQPSEDRALLGRPLRRRRDLAPEHLRDAADVAELGGHRLERVERDDLQRIERQRPLVTGERLFAPAGALAQKLRRGDQPAGAHRVRLLRAAVVGGAQLRVGLGREITTPVMQRDERVVGAHRVGGVGAGRQRRLVERQRLVALALALGDLPEAQRALDTRSRAAQVQRLERGARFVPALERERRFAEAVARLRVVVGGRRCQRRAIALERVTELPEPPARRALRRQRARPPRVVVAQGRQLAQRRLQRRRRRRGA